MYILPDATIKIYESVPFDSNYQNTCLFASASAQRSYFNGLTSKTFTKFTYQRMNRDYIQVSGIADDYQNVNYLTFQNSPTSKIYYCFVDSVQYVNVGCARLSITIDVQQTYMFDYELLDCYVEREHSVTDEIGDNIVEERLPIGELEYRWVSALPIRTGETAENYSIVTVTTFAYTSDGVITIGNKTVTSIQGGVPQGLYYHVLDSLANPPDLLRQFIQAATDANVVDGIVSIFVAPTELISIGTYDPTPVESYTIPDHDKLPFTPKNNKLYTYPYCQLLVTDLCGADGIFKYEFFGSGLKFTLTMPSQPEPVIFATPLNYNMDGGYSIHPLSVYNLKSNALPKISYSVDSLSQWIAQNRVGLAVNVISSVLSLAAAPAAGAAPLVAGMAGNAISTMGEMLQASTLPAQLHNSGGVNSLVPAGIFGYQVFNMHVNETNERIIDDYFTLYGYATNRLKVPNRNSRPHWNYVKTNWCNLEGNIPADARQQLEEIYNRGITFWKVPSEIGNYSLDNSPS